MSKLTGVVDDDPDPVEDELHVEDELDGGAKNRGAARVVIVVLDNCWHVLGTDHVAGVNCNMHK